MQDNLFRCVEREFYSYTENCRYLESLELRKQCIPAFRSSSDFSERVDTGTNYSDPVSIWFEKVELLEEEIARYRLRTIPISKMLSYLEDCEPELLRLFRLRYVQQMKWVMVDAEMGLSEKVRRSLRSKLVSKGARFLGLRSLGGGPLPPLPFQILGDAKGQGGHPGGVLALELQGVGEGALRKEAGDEGLEALAQGGQGPFGGPRGG